MTNHPTIDVVFAGVEGDPLLVHIILFSSRFPEGTLTSGQIDTESEKLLSGRGKVLGSVDASGPFASDKANLKKYGPADWMRRIIEIESETNPTKVGGPIDLLELKVTGHDWIKPKGACEN